MKVDHVHCWHNSKGDYCGFGYAHMILHGRFQEKTDHVAEDVKFCCNCGYEKEIAPKLKRKD